MMRIYQLLFLLLWTGLPLLLQGRVHANHRHHHRSLVAAKAEETNDSDEDEPTQEEIQATMQLVQDYESQQQSAAVQRARSTNHEQPDNDQRTTFVIPVFVHLILTSRTQTTTTGALQNSDVATTIDLLNQAYNATPFVFQLVQVTRTVNVVWYTCDKEMDDQFKAQLHQGGTDALNVYVCDTVTKTSIRGWASYPWSLVDDLVEDTEDGIVVTFRTIHGADQYIRHTLTHEVGHFLGLYHTNQGGCSGLGDGVEDTPALKVADLTDDMDCTVPLSTCDQDGIGDQDDDDDDNTNNSIGLYTRDNFMDTGNEACRSRFTTGQITRMKIMYESFRRANRTKLENVIVTEPDSEQASTSATTANTEDAFLVNSVVDHNNEARQCVGPGEPCLTTLQCCTEHVMICAADVCVVQNKRPSDETSEHDKLYNEEESSRGNVNHGTRNRRKNTRMLKGSAT